MTERVSWRIVTTGVDSDVAPDALVHAARAVVRHGAPVDSPGEADAIARVVVELARARGLEVDVHRTPEPKLPPLFSVIVPTCDRPEMVVTAVSSVLQQAVRDIEVLVVDDGMDPLVHRWDDARVRVLRTTGHEGPGAARNVGLVAARGSFVAFLDDDDEWTVDRLDLALEGLVRAPVAICWTRHMEDSAPTPGRRLDGFVGDRLLEGTTPCLGATAVSRECVGAFDPQWRGIEDVVWWWSLARRAPVATVPKVGYLVRLHAGDRGRNPTDVRVEENLALIRAHAWFFLRHRRALAHRLLRTALLARQSGRTLIAAGAGAAHLILAPRIPSLVRDRMAASKTAIRHMR